jgi:hypothetical protein
MRQHFTLGQAMAAKYPKIFNDHKTSYSNTYHIFAATMNKSIESAQSHLHGIYGTLLSPKIDFADSDRYTKTPYENSTAKNPKKAAESPASSAFAIDSVFKPVHVTSLNPESDQMFFADIKKSCAFLEPTLTHWKEKEYRSLNNKTESLCQKLEDTG